MARVALVALIIAVVCMFSEEASAQDKRCTRENEYWNDCGTACPLTCEEPEPRGCVKRCDRGCKCKEGFLRRCDGACVRWHDCWL